MTAMTTPAGWMSFRGTYSLSDREWSLENGGNVIYPVRNDASFSFRRYHEAERDREELELDLSLTQLDCLGFSLLYKTALNDYKKSQYGLKSDDYRSFSADVNYAFGYHNLFAFYVKEKNKGFQAARQTTFPPFDVISNDPLNDWTAMLSDTTTTFGLGAEITMIPNKLELEASFNHSKTKGKSLLYSPPGGNLDLAANFDKDLDTTKYTIAKARLFYTLNDHLQIGLSEWYESISWMTFSRMVSTWICCRRDMPSILERWKRITSTSCRPYT